MTHRSRTILDVVLAVLLLGSIASTFAPWLRSGESRRSSYEVVRTADRLELLGPVARSVGRFAWATLPLAASLALLALARERRAVAGALALWVAAVEGLLAASLRRVPQVADWGVAVALALTVGLAVVGVLTLIGARRTT